MLADLFRAAAGFWRFRIALALTLCVGLFAIIGPFIAQHDPIAQFTEVLIDDKGRLAGPFEVSGFWLGADAVGRDEFSRLVHGGKVSLIVAVVASSIAVSLGLLVGMLAGYLSGPVDSFLMRLVDFVLSLPFLLVAIALNRVINRPDMLTVAVLLGLLSWTSLARVVRTKTLQVRRCGYVIAARALGYGPWHIMWRHILPNVSAPALVLGTTTLGNMILMEAAMSFLGLGVRPPVPSWGSMLREAQDLMIHAPHLVLFPGLLVGMAVFAFNLMGEALRDVLDVRSH